MEKQLKLLLLGCGDIGARVAEQINRQRWAVAGMRRRVEMLPSDITAFSGDICSGNALREVLLDYSPDALIITLTPSEMSDDGYVRSYVAGAKALLDSVKGMAHKPQILWASSTAVYGQSHGEWVDENSVVSPTSYRGKRLLEAEQILLGSTLPVSIVRFSGIYGPGRTRLVNNVRMGKLASPEQPQWGNRIHSEDCAGVLVHLLTKFVEHQPVQPVYLATDNMPTLAHKMQRELAASLGVSFTDQEVPENPISTGRRCRNHQLVGSGYQFLYPTWRDGYKALLSEGEQIG